MIGRKRPAPPPPPTRFKDLKSGDLFRWVEVDDREQVGALLMRLQYGTEYVKLSTGALFACDLGDTEEEVVRVPGRIVIVQDAA